MTLHLIRRGATEYRVCWGEKALGYTTLTAIDVSLQIRVAERRWRVKRKKKIGEERLTVRRKIRDF